MKRKGYPRPSFTRAIRHTLAASALAIAMSVSAGEGSTVSIYANSLSAAATVSQPSSIELRVAGPGGFRDSRQSETGALDWYPGGLADGEYRYEVFVTVGDKPAEGAADTTRLYRENGRFKVENGTLMPVEDAGTPPLPGSDGQTSLNSAPWYEKLATGMLDFLVPPAAAASLITNPGDLYLTDTNPYIYWNDTDSTGVDWYTFGTSISYGVYDMTGGHYIFYAGAGTAFSINELPTYFYLWNHSVGDFAFYIHETAGANVLYAGSNGDIELADGSVYIDKSANYLGVGTITPTDDIHVVSPSPALLLEDTIGGDIRIENGGGELAVYRANGSYNGYIFNIENDLGSGIYPGVGIWEINPKVPLHVGSHDDMSAGLLVENTLAPTAAGDVTMFRLENTGDKIVRFAIEAGGASSIWTFDNEPTYNGGAGINSGRFRVAKSGTGVTEFSVDGYGNGRFYGNSYAVNHVNTSSRESKTDFVALNEQDVLARLMQLPVSEWRYKQESKESRHIGPVAEDFKQTFGLGDGKHISTVDSDGVALAAIKAVKAEKDAEIAALVKQNQALSERLNALEELLLNQQQVSAR